MQRVDELLDLPLRIARTQPLSAHDRLALEEAHVAREQDPPFARGEPASSASSRSLLVARVESQQPQVACERAEVNVRHEARFAQRPRPQSMNRRDVEPLELRINRDALAALQPSIETDRRPSTRMRSISVCGTPSDSIASLTEGVPAIAHADRALPLIGRKVVVELLVEAELTCALQSLWIAHVVSK